MFNDMEKFDTSRGFTEPDWVKLITEDYPGLDAPKKPWTPFWQARQMVNRTNKTGSCLVICDFSLLYTAVNYAQFSDIVFIPYNSDQEKAARLICSKKENVRVLNIDYNNINNIIDSAKKELGKMKFDVIVGNPPYGALHIPILRICIDSLKPDGKAVTIQPIRWLQDPLWLEKERSDAKKMFPVLDGKLDSVDIVSSAQASQIFGANFTMDLGIFVVNAAGGQFPYTALNDYAHGLDISPFKHCLRPNTFTQDKYKNQQHFVPLKIIVAAGSGRARANAWSALHTPYGYFMNGLSNNCKYGDGLTYEEATKANRWRRCGRLEGSNIKAFNSSHEARNFFGYITLEAFRFFVLISTVDANIQCNFLPFPAESDAYTSTWSNARFFEYFNIIPRDQQLILETMKHNPSPF